QGALDGVLDPDARRGRRSELILPQPDRERRGRSEEQPGAHEGGGVRDGVGDEEPDEEPENGSDDGRHRPERGGQRVGDEQLVARDDAWEAGGQRGEEEPVDAERDEREHVDRGGHPARADEDGEHEREDDPDGVAEEQHLSAAPAVEERPGERPDDREGQEEDGEGRGDSTGRGHVLRAEEEEGRQAHLEHPVPALGDEPDREELAEAGVHDERAQVGQDAHGWVTSGRNGTGAGYPRAARGCGGVWMGAVAGASARAAHWGSSVWLGPTETPRSSGAGARRRLDDRRGRGTGRVGAGAGAAAAVLTG